MFRVLFRDLGCHFITKKKPTSQILHLNVFYSVLVQKTENPSLKSIKKTSFTVDYLVNSCGLPPDKALSAAKKFNLCSVEKADSVISFFQSYGLNKTHITKIISLRPQLLRVDPSKNLKPKVDFLCDLGVSEPDLTKLIVTHPSFLTSNLNSQIIPCFNFLKNYIKSDAGIMLLLRRWHSIFLVNLEKVLKPNISILQVHSVSNHNIARMFINTPPSLTGNSNRFKEIVEKVKKMGFNPLSPKFCTAVSTMTSMKESSWDKKLAVYQDFGLLENDVISAFKKHPKSLNISEENIRRSLKFFHEKLKCKPIDISLQPALLLYSLEKRIIPRCAVLKILFTKGIIRKKMSLDTIIKMTEKVFSEKFVIIYRESFPEVMKAYEGGIEFVGFEEVVQVKGLSIKPGLLAV